VTIGPIAAMPEAATMEAHSVGTDRPEVIERIAVCDHCGCRQGSIAELMDQHDRISELGADVRILIARDDERTAQARMADLLTILRPHMTWEEKGLFPRITAQGDFADHVADLEAEHEGLFAALDAAGKDPRGWGAAISDVLNELDSHMYRENFGLFPGAIAVLDADDWDAIAEVRPLDRLVAVLVNSVD
jgi:iron-sulfur cluster repair protein YtfE (RIC family)